LRFGLLGFPVQADLSFLIVLAFLGYSTLDRGLSFLVVWVVIAALSILVHELGHAVAARATGASPHIALIGFGGVTSFDTPTGGLSRVRSVGISVAGPATGLALGGVLLLIRRSAALDPGSLTAYAVDAGIFVTLGWGILNLLPILPLDGGNVLVELLPGSPERRLRLAAAVSVAFAVIAGVFALLAGQLYAALLAGWFAIGNVSTARARPAVAPAPAMAPLPGTAGEPVAAGQGPPTGLPGTTGDQQSRQAQDSRAVLWLLDQNRPAEARHLAETAPAGIDAGVAGVLLVALGDVARGTELVHRAAGEAPQDGLRQECLRRLARGG
jgi:Zn-dependent protease